MNATQQQVLTMFRNVHEYLTANPPAPPGGRAPNAFQPQMDILNGILTRVEGHAVDQDVGSRLVRQATERQTAVRQQLIEAHMRPIALIARSLLPEEPGIQRALYVPKPKTRAESILTAAQAMAEAAEPYSTTFVDAGLPEDFIAQLQSVAQQFRDSLGGKRSNRDRRRSATLTLPDDITRGRRAVRRLDAIARVFYGKTDLKLLNGWKSAKQLRRFSVSGHAGTDTGTAPTPTPVPAGNSTPAGVPAAV